MVPRIGRKPALKVAIVNGPLLAFAICYWRVPQMAVTATLPLLGIGLALFMAAFDVLPGRWLLKRPWPRAFEDSNPAGGNYLLFGIVLLVFFPWLAMQLHALWSGRRGCAAGRSEPPVKFSA